MFNLAHRLRRRTTSGNWIPEIDGLRCIAILAVVLCHMQGEIHRHESVVVQGRYHILDSMLGSGVRGVALFFVISGYILGRPFAAHYLQDRERPSLKKYFLRRITRLEPPYILNLLVSAAALFFLDHISGRILLPHLLANIVYMHHLFTLLFPPLFLINSVTWSLEVEVQFYLLAPLLAMVFLIRRGMLRRLVIALAMVAAGLLKMRFGLANPTLAGQIQYFLAGLLLVDLVITVMSHWSHDWRWDLVSLVGWPLVFLLPESCIDLWLPWLTLLLYVAALRGRSMYQFLRLPWVALTGGMCYTLYLWHPLALTATERFLRRYSGMFPRDYLLTTAIHDLIGAIAIAALCLPLYLWVERPCMDPAWPSHLWSRLRGALASSSDRS